MEHNTDACCIRLLCLVFPTADAAAIHWFSMSGVLVKVVMTLWFLLVVVDVVE